MFTFALKARIPALSLKEALTGPGKPLAFLLQNLRRSVSDEEGILLFQILKPVIKRVFTYRFRTDTQSLSFLRRERLTVNETRSLLLKPVLIVRLCLKERRKL